MPKRVIESPIVDYPDSDGKPMAETDVHRDLLLDVVERLKARYLDRTDVYVSGNLFVYYAKGNPSAVLAPDTFVVFGVQNKTRRSFRVWTEGDKFPDVVFEFTSARTQDQDLETKFNTYQDVWKVKEYFLFDPYEEYLDPPLLGFRMVKGELVPIEPVGEVLKSKALGMTLARDGARLVLRDAVTGKELPTRNELKAEKRVEDTESQAEKLVKQAEARAADAAAENARLKAELDALRKKSAK